MSGDRSPGAEVGEYSATGQARDASSTVSQIDPRGRLRFVIWLCLFLAIYGLMGPQNTSGFIWWSVLGVACSLVPLAVVGFHPGSTVSLIVLLHILYFPVAAWVNLIPEAPGVYESDLWRATPVAMGAMAVGMVGLGCGAWLMQRARRIPDQIELHLGREWSVPWSLVGLAGMGIVIYAYVRWRAGTYFHVFAAGASGWSEQGALSTQVWGYLEYISYAAAFFQLRRALSTRARRDVLLAVFLVLLPVLVMLPSGSRDRILRGSIPVLAVGLLTWTQRIRTKGTALLVAVGILVVVVLQGVEIYRSTIYYDLRNVSWSERASLLVEGGRKAVLELDEQADRSIRLVGRRLADYVSVGRIVEVFPSQQSWRYGEGLYYWPFYILPRPLRPDTPRFDPRDSARLAREVGFKGGTLGGSGEGSSPAMVLGDLFSRGGWVMIFVGMVGLGALFRFLDSFLMRFTPATTLLYGFLLVPITKLPQDSVFGHFMFFTRTTLLGVLFSWAFLRIARALPLGRLRGRNLGSPQRSAESDVSGGVSASA